MNKNLGALISWREGGTPRKNTLDFLESNFLAIRQTSQYKRYSKIIRRARFLRKGLIRRVRAQHIYKIKNSELGVSFLEYTDFRALTRQIRAYKKLIKQYIRKSVCLLKGKDPYAMLENVIINVYAMKLMHFPPYSPCLLFLIRNSLPELSGLQVCGHTIEGINQYFPPARFDYFPHPKGFYVREKPILSDNILQHVFELLNRHGKDKNGNTRKN